MAELKFAGIFFVRGNCFIDDAREFLLDYEISAGAPRAGRVRIAVGIGCGNRPVGAKKFPSDRSELRE
jgi:hypothetical protein